MSHFMSTRRPLRCLLATLGAQIDRMLVWPAKQIPQPEPSFGRLTGFSSVPGNPPTRIQIRLSDRSSSRVEMDRFTRGKSGDSRGGRPCSDGLHEHDEGAGPTELGHQTRCCDVVVQLSRPQGDIPSGCSVDHLRFGVAALPEWKSFHALQVNDGPTIESHLDEFGACLGFWGGEDQVLLAAAHGSLCSVRLYATAVIPEGVPVEWRTNVTRMTMLCQS